jgi:hypothetical protein
MNKHSHQAMTWLHTWMGLMLGFVLMVCFFGALSVFDRETDRWAIPQTRFEPQTACCCPSCSRRSPTSRTTPPTCPCCMTQPRDR